MNELENRHDDLLLSVNLGLTVSAEARHSQVNVHNDWGPTLFTSWNVNDGTDVDDRFP